MKYFQGALMLSFVLLMAVQPSTLWASSHREAPAITEDCAADNTDVYAFISPEDPDKLVIVASTIPLAEPSSGPSFYGFSDRLRYEIHVDNDGDAISDIVYQFNFNTQIRDDTTSLYNTGPIASPDDSSLTRVQSYDLLRIVGGSTEVVVKDAPVAPPNVGPASFPGDGYESVAQQAIVETGDGLKVFAGPRDDSYFADYRAIFDLFQFGSGGGTDTFAGHNVLSLVLQVPIADIAAGGMRPAAGTTGPTSVAGIHATTNERRTRVWKAPAGPQVSRGNFVQVSRAGMPLTNTLVIPLRDKDSFNRTSPHLDFDNYGGSFFNPAIVEQLNTVAGANCPPTTIGSLSTFAASTVGDPGGDRESNILALYAPFGAKLADLLRIKITEGQTFADTEFPNGRKLDDDVMDRVLTLLCAKIKTGIAIGDGVEANDVPFGSAFPFLAKPH